MPQIIRATTLPNNYAATVGQVFAPDFSFASVTTAANLATFLFELVCVCVCVCVWVGGGGER